MIGQIVEYKIIEYIKPVDSLFEDWLGEVSKYIYSRIGGQNITLINFERSDLSSILTEFISGQVLSNINNKIYEYTTICNVSEDVINLIVNSEEFYLGYVCLVIGTLNKSEIENIIIQNNKDLYLTGKQIIKMGFDGNYLYLINI